VEHLRRLRAPDHLHRQRDSFGPQCRLPVPTIQSSVLEFVFDTTREVANLISSGTLKRYPEFLFSHEV
jgi:hypothetical protein